MSRRRVLAAGLALAVVSVGAVSGSGDGRPPHVERPVAGASAPLPLAAVGGDIPAAAMAQVEWFEGVHRARWFEGVAAAEEAARVAAARAAAVERVAAPRAGGASAGCAELAAEFGLPEHVLWRESRCSYDAYNATGCGGRGCIGAAQLDAGHFAASSAMGWCRSLRRARPGVDRRSAGVHPPPLRWRVEPPTVGRVTGERRG